MWHRFAGAIDASRRRAILHAIAKHGVVTDPVDEHAPAGTGMLVFDAVDPEVCALVRRLSAGGRDRVLAVAHTDGALRNGDAWRLLRHGASDVVVWSGRDEAVAAVAARLERWERIDSVLESGVVQRNVVGAGAAWRTTLRAVVEAALFTTAPVLVTGETGTGKELVARLIHTLDQRPRKRDLVVLDCTTIARELSGSEFFGHERGAFTGAVSGRDGALALADGGTLFLDEIGDLSLPHQAELLRAVQERTYKRVGSDVWRKSDFRLVCATNRDLRAEVARGAFRSDLYHRLAGVTCCLPPLRDRPEDVIPLALHFTAELSGDGRPRVLDEPVREYLVRRAYPGNIRDLRQLVHRIMQRHVGPGPVTVGDIPDDERPREEDMADDWRDDGFATAIRRAITCGVGLQDIGRLAKEKAIEIVVQDERTTRGAARRLGVSDRALQMRRAARKRDDLHSAGEDRA